MTMVPVREVSAQGTSKIALMIRISRTLEE
jgi:hypothetical protein